MFAIQNHTLVTVQCLLKCKNTERSTNVKPRALHDNSKTVYLQSEYYEIVLRSIQQLVKLRCRELHCNSFENSSKPITVPHVFYRLNNSDTKCRRCKNCYHMLKCTTRRADHTVATTLGFTGAELFLPISKRTVHSSFVHIPYKMSMCIQGFRFCTSSSVDKKLSMWK